MAGSLRPPEQVVIGLDVGTTATKAVACGLGSRDRVAAVREYPLLEPRPGWQVQDPAAVVAAVHGALAECVANSAGTDVAAIGVSTPMHGLLGLDARLEPLTPLLTWADARSAEQARILRRSGQAAELHRRTGTPVHPMTPMTKLMWFARHEPQIWASARWWVGLKDYVLLHLTGELATELSSASGTGLLDLASRTWSPEALTLAGVSPERLPPIHSTTSSFGLAATAARRVGLPPGLPVVLGAGDGPLGNLGTGATSPGVAGLSLGTSGAARMVVPQPRVDPAGTLFCYALTESAWVVGGAISNGGIVVRWAEQALMPDVRGGPDGVDEAVLALAASVPAGCNGLVMLPYLLSERAPLWDPDLPGAYLGVRREHTRGHFVRAAVEGVCLQLALIVDELDRITPVTSVRATGGAFRSALWRAVLAAALGRPLYVMGDAEGSALGAGALGLVALGRARDLTGATAMLADPEAGEAEPVNMDPSLVAAAERLRVALAERVRELGAVADLFRPVSSPGSP